MSDKPWMRPMQYIDSPAPRDTLANEVPLESEQGEDGVALVNRPSGDRSAVKPVGGVSLDNTPMRYTPFSKVRNVFELDDNDEIEPEEPEDEETPPAYF